MVSVHEPATHVRPTSFHATAASDGRAPLFDVLRCLGVFAVMVEHFGARHWFALIGLEQVNVGGAALRWFYVLSGFLITGILLKYRDGLEQGTLNAGTAIRTFFARRVARIFPIYYLTVLVCWIFGVEVAREYLAWFLLYLSNILAATTDKPLWPLSHFWSLAVEEQFYLTWPFFILLAPRRYLLPGAVVAVVIGLCSRFWLHHAGYPPNVWAGLPTSCFDAIGMGVITILVRRNPTLHRHWRILTTVLGLGIGLPTLLFHFFKPFEGGFGFFFGNFLFAAIVDRCYEIRLTSPSLRRLAKPLVYLGTISYGIYVVHQPVWHAFHSVMNATGHALPRAVQPFVGMAIAVALASISWHVMERPLLLARRDVSDKSPQPLAQAL